MVALFTFRLSDLLTKIYHHKSHILICGERPLSNQSDPKTPSKLRFANDRFRSVFAFFRLKPNISNVLKVAILAANQNDNLVVELA